MLSHCSMCHVDITPSSPGQCHCTRQGSRQGGVPNLTHAHGNLVANPAKTRGSDNFRDASRLLRRTAMAGVLVWWRLGNHPIRKGKGDMPCCNYLADNPPLLVLRNSRVHDFGHIHIHECAIQEYLERSRDFHRHVMYLTEAFMVL